MSDGAFCRKWERALRDMPDEYIPPGYRKVSLYAVCHCIASYGNNGKGCFPGLRRIMADLGCTNHTVINYRRLAVSMGWFRESIVKRKTGALDIAIPSDFQLTRPREQAAQAAEDKRRLSELEAAWGADDEDPWSS